MVLLLEPAVIGLLATALTDLWQQLLRRGAGLPGANWRLIGRWVAGTAGGVFTHRSIADAEPRMGETAVGWTFHYLVGIAYAGLYLALVRIWPQIEPTFAGALLFGAVTLIAPWCILQPALGFGVMARRLPNRKTVTAVTVTTHLVFGAGLYLGVSLELFGVGSE